MMWVTSRGARPWRAPSITATSVSAGLAFLAAAVAAPSALAGEAADPVAWVYRAAAAYGALAGGPSEADLRGRCGVDALCAARRIAAASSGRAMLAPVDHPDSDTIRWAASAPSVTAVEEGADGRRWIVLERFGRKAAGEVAAALAPRAGAAPPGAVALDLRGNAGGDFGRMLRVASLFTGDVRNALFLSGKKGRTPIDLERKQGLASATPLTVLVGPTTASSAEVLAALLHRYAGARLVGRPTAGKDHLTRVIAVDHDWRLLVAAERVEVPGVRLAGGLRPEARAP